MAKGEVWTQTKELLHIGKRSIAEARFFVAQDDTQPLDKAFEMLVSLRFLGAQVDNDPSQHFPVADGSVAVKITVTTPATVVKGVIANWHGIEGNADKDGNPIAGHGKSVAVGADWSKVNQVGFTLSGEGTVTVPVASILAAIPTLKFAALLLGSALPVQIPIEISYPPIEIPIHRDANNKVVLQPHAVTPKWWP